MSEILDRNPGVLDYLTDINFLQIKVLTDPQMWLGLENVPGSPKTNLWYNKTIITDACK